MAVIDDRHTSLGETRDSRCHSRGTVARGLTVLSVVAGCALAGVLGYVGLAGGSGDMLARGYSRAFALSETAWSTAQPGHLWLSGLGEQPAALRKAVVIGDRITVGGSGRSDVFEVVGLEQIDGEPLGSPALRIQVVTARVDGSVTGETVRFLFAVDGPATAPAAPKPDKVL